MDLFALCFNASVCSKQTSPLFHIYFVNGRLPGQTSPTVVCKFLGSQAVAHGNVCDNRLVDILGATINQHGSGQLVVSPAQFKFTVFPSDQ